MLPLETFPAWGPELSADESERVYWAACRLKALGYKPAETLEALAKAKEDSAWLSEPLEVPGVKDEQAKVQGIGRLLELTLSVPPGRVMYADFRTQKDPVIAAEVANGELYVQRTFVDGAASGTATVRPAPLPNWLDPETLKKGDRFLLRVTKQEALFLEELRTRVAEILPAERGIRGLFDRRELDASPGWLERAFRTLGRHVFAAPSVWFAIQDLSREALEIREEKTADFDRVMESARAAKRELLRFFRAIQARLNARKPRDPALAELKKRFFEEYQGQPKKREWLLRPSTRKRYGGRSVETLRKWVREGRKNWGAEGRGP